MKTATVNTQPPAALLQAVQHLKAHFPFRICWGAFNPANPAETETGADHTKRRLNAALRKGWLAFQL